MVGYRAMTPLQLMQVVGINPTPATHAEYLSAWEKVKEMAKTFTDMEMTMRKALFAATFPTPKEGANNFTLEDGRKIAATHKISRSIDASQITLARSEYSLVNDRPVEFDELLKVEYSLVTSAYRKIEPAPGQSPSPAYMAASRMIVTKAGAPTLEVK